MTRDRAWIAFAVAVAAAGSVVMLLTVANEDQATPESTGTVDVPTLADPPELAGCPNLAAENPEVWTAYSNSSVTLRTGPGDEFAAHESGELLPNETIRVLGLCNGWIQARVLELARVGQVYAQHGKDRADEMLTFWVPADSVRRR